MPAEADYTIIIGRTEFSQNPTGPVSPGATIQFQLADDRPDKATVDVNTRGLFVFTFTVKQNDPVPQTVHADAAGEYTFKADRSTTGVSDPMTGTINVGSDEGDDDDEDGKPDRGKR